MDFQKDVIEASSRVPVLVDFWAEWCGPCRVLGPVLEGLELQAKGAWKLVKINVDENRELSTQFKIQGIPAVKLFVDGLEVDGFTGALPDYQIQSWLNRRLPSEVDKTISKMKEELTDNPEKVKQEAAELLKEEDSKTLRLFLAELLIKDDPTRTLELIDDFRPGDTDFDKAADVKALAQLNLKEFEGESPAKAFLNAASKSMKEGDEDSVFESLVQAVMVDKSYAEDLPRRACIAMFRQKGQKHPLTLKFRPRFDMALY